MEDERWEVADISVHVLNQLCACALGLGCPVGAWQNSLLRPASREEAVISGVIGCPCITWIIMR